MIKRNLDLFKPDEMDKIREYLETKLTSYIDGTQTYRKEQTKWVAAYNCVYRKEDHRSKTDSKIFDNETHDAIDTITKRCTTAMFTNKKISKLEYTDYEEIDNTEMVESFWDKILEEINLRKIFNPIIKDGLITGTLLSVIRNNYKKIAKYKTIQTPDGNIRVKTYEENKIPSIDYVNIFDLIVDPTVSNIELSEVVGEKRIISEKDLEDDTYYIKSNINIYKNKFQDNTTDQTDEEKKESLRISGIDIDEMLRQNVRAVYECYFDWEVEELEGEPVVEKFFAIVDACTFEILRIEPNPHDDGMLPYTSQQYLTRSNLFYGIGAPEQAWQLQVMLNEVYNQYLDSIDINNSMNLLCMDTAVIGNNPVNVGRMKFIPVQNPGNVIQLRNNSLPEVQNMVYDLRQEIQKKTKATMILQGQPLQGQRTATETIGIKEETNLSLKDIIQNMVNFLQSTLNKYKKCLVQSYDNDTITLKVPVSDEMDKFQIIEVSFDDIRPLLDKAIVQIIGIEEQETKVMKIGELRNLLSLGMQRPDIINIPYIMKSLYKDYLNFDDFDKMISYSITPNTPLTVERETQILSSGNPLNTNSADNDEEHLTAHQKLFDDLVAQMNDSRNPQMNTPSMQEVFKKIILNITNHLNEHMMQFEQKLKQEEEMKKQMEAMEENAE